MCLDRRFPWLHRIAHAPIPADERRRAGRFAGAVSARTGTDCVFNANTGGLFFFYGSVDYPAWEFPFRPDDETAVRVTDTDVDDVVRIIQMGKLSREEKDRIAQDNKAREASEKEQSMGRRHDHREREAVNMLGYLDRKRRGVERVTV